MRHIILAVWLLAFPFLIDAADETPDQWTPAVKKSIDSIVRKGSGRNLTVVFDMDNTLLCRDIGYAVFGVLYNDGSIKASKIGPTLAPPFRIGDKVFSLQDGTDLFEYIGALHAATRHQNDKQPHTTAYAWLVQAMAGLSPIEITEATKKAYQNGIAEQDRGKIPGETKIEGKTGYPLPFIYPEMVRLISRLQKNQFDVWIISGSNAWTVRWMILNVLNPKLKETGAPGIPPDRAIGISTLIQDKNGVLYKDHLLTLSDPAYGTLDPETLKRFKLTALVDEPISGYSGKVAMIYFWIDREPYLIAGDSSNDFAMLKRAANRLWIGRLEDPDYQRDFVAMARENQPKRWVVQPTLIRQSPGFVSSQKALEKRSQAHREKISESISILKQAGFLTGF